MRRHLSIGLCAAAFGAGCPSDPAFQASDTAVVDDTATSADDALDTATCVPTCAALLAAGQCGDDGCGGSCLCPGAVACVQGSCPAAEPNNMVARTTFGAPVAAAIRRDGAPAVVTITSNAPEHSDVTLFVLDWDGSFMPVTVAADVDAVRALALGFDGDGDPVVLVETGSADESNTRWYSRDGGGAFQSAPMVAGQDCVMPRAENGVDGLLYVACVELYGEWPLHLFRVDTGGSKHLTGVMDRPGVGSLDDDSHSVVWPVHWLMDAEGEPRIAYSCCGRSAPELAYAGWNGVSWGEQRFGTRMTATGNQSRNVAVSLDEGGAPHVIYQDADSDFGLLMDRHWDGVDWAVDYVDSGNDVGVSVGEQLAVARDATGRIHLAYGYGRALFYKRWNEPAWSAEVVAPHVFTTFEHLALVVDPAGVAHVAYADTDNKLRWWTPPEPAAPVR